MSFLKVQQNDASRFGTSTVLYSSSSSSLFLFVSKRTIDNTGQQKKIFLLVPQILELFWSIFGALIPKMTAVFSHQL